MLRLSVFTFFFLSMSWISADAQPPADADPALHDWFESLRQPETGMSCCSIADCRPVDDRLVPGGYEAFVDSRWVAVPDNKVLRGRPNPTARAVLCRTPGGAILCFVPANET